MKLRELHIFFPRSPRNGRVAAAKAGMGFLAILESYKGNKYWNNGRWYAFAYPITRKNYHQYKYFINQNAPIPMQIDLLASHDWEIVED